MIRLSDALGQLPFVQPRKAMSLLKQIQEDSTDFDMVNGEIEIVENDYVFDDYTITAKEAKELRIEGGLGAFPVLLISPLGADILVKMYLSNELPILKGKKVGLVGDVLSKYIHALPALLEEQSANETLANEAREKRNNIVSNPSLLLQDDFSFSILNEIFWRHCNPNDKSPQPNMLIGGVNVHRTIARYQSNSGKTADYDVTFNWIDAGQQKALSKSSKFTTNRRNDPDRNWGLG